MNKSFALTPDGVRNEVAAGADTSFERSVAEPVAPLTGEREEPGKDSPDSGNEDPDTDTTYEPVPNPDNDGPEGGNQPAAAIAEQESISLEEAQKLIEEAYLRGRNERIEREWVSPRPAPTDEEDEVAALFHFRKSVWADK